MYLIQWQRYALSPHPISVAHRPASGAPPGGGAVRQWDPGGATTPLGPSAEVAVMRSSTWPGTAGTGGGIRLPATTGHPGAGLGA